MALRKLLRRGPYLGGVRAGCALARRVGYGLAQGFLDALGAGGSDALIDPECLAQVVQALAGEAILKVAVADAFEGACFLKGDADVAGEDERLIVMVAGLAGGRGPR